MTDRTAAQPDGVCPPSPRHRGAELTLRHHWMLDPGRVHLNHGSFGAVPRETLAHQQELREEMERDPVEWFQRLPGRVAAARRQVARLLGAPEAATAFVANASAGVTVVLQALELPLGSRIVITDHLYGAVTMAVHRAAARRGADVETVHLPLHWPLRDIAERMVAALDARTRLVVVDQISSATARLFPVAEIAEACRARGIPLLVDGAHAPGMLAHPLAGLHGTYWVGNLHKWTCAPRGSAVLVADPADPDERRRLHPPIDSWGTPDAYPERFDQQGTQDLTAWLAAPHAPSLIEQLHGWTAARRFMAGLAEHGQRIIAERWGADLGEVRTAPAPAMRLVPLPPGHATDQDSAHALQQVISSRYGCATAITTWHGRGFLRLSAHLYNAPADYEHLAERCAELFG
ncbi:aminotransferase class V-fold PLP-dependent enzyme [Streptomyces sp. NPDC052396]|uniref:aminotransferase class V-fold PLP-dependent enzyme n=1 Tax=Streptomyces sp. NPDC052396 TaxID=3365689 RepID=UPI0037CFDF2B